MTSLRTITFDQFSSSFLNKIIDFLKKNESIFNGTVYCML